MLDALRIVAESIAESMNQVQAAIAHVFSDTNVQELMQQALTQASQAQLEAAKAMVPIKTVHQHAMLRGISTSMVGWTRTFEMHPCGQAFVVETNGTSAKYYDVEADKRELCVTCGMPYSNDNQHLQQYAIHCPGCSEQFLVTEYNGERSFSQGAYSPKADTYPHRVYYCPNCMSLLDRHIPTMFLNQYVKEHANPSESKATFQNKAMAWFANAEEACERARDAAYGSGLHVRLDARKTLQQIQEELDGLQEKWDSKVEVSNLKVVPDEDEYDWEHWQKPLSTTYTEEELVTRIKKESSANFTSYLKNAIHGDASQVKPALELDEILSAEHKATHDILEQLLQQTIGMEEAISLLLSASDTAATMGRPESIISEALQAARKLQTMQDAKTGVYQTRNYKGAY